MILFALLVVTWVWVCVLLRRLHGQERQIREQERQVASLTSRVWRLENAAAPAAPATAPAPTPAPAPELVREVVHDTPVAEAPATPHTPRTEDWETRLGANWLNRAGALILVVGIALFLGYSLTQLGPAGKVAIGFVVGLSLLGAGVVLEGREPYRNFSFSLMGAGWAVIYFTAYATHGLPAARIIEDPAAAAALLVLISAAMIGHALRYRSEVATTLAFLFGFVSLNVSPLTSFSVIASLFLALAMIVLAYRLEWFRLPVAGVLFTYLTFLLRYDPSVYGRAGILNGQSTLWIYWFAFEAYDLLDLRRRGAAPGLERSVFLLNAFGFAGASMLHEWRMTSQDWSVFFLLSALAYVASAIVRSRWARVEGSPSESIVSGGYEGASTVAAALMAASLIERFDGLSMTFALLLEAEMVLLAGLALRNSYVQNLGALMLSLPLFRLLAINVPEGGEVAVAGLKLERWTPLAALMAAVFSVNRRFVATAWVFPAGAAVLVFVISAAELPSQWIAPAWAAIAVAAFFASAADVRWLSVAAGILAALAALVEIADQGSVATTVLTVALLYGLHLLWRGRGGIVGPVLSVVATGVMTALIFDEVQGRLLTVACGAEGAALLSAGFLLQERSYRLSGLLLFLFCVAKLFVYDLRELDTGSRILSFIVLGVMMLAASWVYARFRDKLSRLL